MVNDISAVVGITAGGTHTCAVGTPGVWCWGGNGNGQLGTGDSVARTIATPVLAPE
jgi:alpha-tubulin suppressor-like RCC1 family protein